MNKNKIWITSDWHITASVPKCRMETEEEWLLYQLNLMNQVKELVGDDLLVNGGDVIDVAIPYKTNSVVNAIIDSSPQNHILIAGNHCSKGMSQDTERALQSGALGVLARSKTITYLEDTDIFEWGDFVIHPSNFKNGRFGEHREIIAGKTNVFVGHFLNYPDTLPPFITDAITAEDFLNEYKEYDYACVGDYHVPYVYDGKFLSPGSLTRRTTKQWNHKPCIWSLDKDGFHQHFLDVPPPEEVMTKEHIDKKTEKDKRFEEWSESVESSEVEELDIEVNVFDYFIKNKTRKNTKELLITTMEEVKG